MAERLLAFDSARPIIQDAIDRCVLGLYPRHELRAYLQAQAGRIGEAIASQPAPPYDLTRDTSLWKMP